MATGFVSANELAQERERRKEKRRISRKEILEEAKESFMKEKKKREMKEARGDDKWIAPGVDQRLSDQPYSSYIKKKKRKNKEKKHKKHKRGDESGEDTWVEKEDQPPLTPPVTTDIADEVAPVVRQEWMTMPLGPSLSRRETTETEEVVRQDTDSMGSHPLELNPYWKDGGRGLPDPDSQSVPVGSVGDGGRSWLLRSYKRALERCEEEGIRIEQIAEDRWGSLDNLYSLLREAGIDPNDPDGPGNDKRYLYAGRDGAESRERSPPTTRKPLERPAYQPFKSSRGFVKPGEGSSSDYKYHDSTSQSWQKKGIDTRPSSDTTAMTTPPHRSPTPPSIPHVKVPQVTDAQLNSLGAKLVKAEMLGDKDKVEKLKRKLDELRELQKSQTTVIEQTRMEDQRSRKQEEVLLLTTTDRYGNSRPLHQPPPAPGYRKKGKHTSTHTDKGKRTKYFSNDDEYSLRDLVEQERRSTAEETQSAIARMAGKFIPSSNFGETVDDALDNKSVLREDTQRQQKKAELRAINDTRAINEALNSCRFCVNNESSFDKHLMVALGIEVYLAVPSEQPLTEGHCYLIPREHTACTLQMDENVWSEVCIFRKGLTRMFADRDMDVVFMEMYSSSNSKRHMMIECVPLPKETGELAPMYFKKAIMEGDQEWSDNKKLIDTSKKGVRGSLPKGLPYFFVEFGTDGGYGHVIEDQTRFPWYFGKEVCGGMLDCEPRLWLKSQRDSFERQKLRVLQLSSWWKDYDWTQKINE